MTLIEMTKGSFIKYVGSDFVILDPLHPEHAHVLLAYTLSPIVRAHRYYFPKEI